MLFDIEFETVNFTHTLTQSTMGGISNETLVLIGILTFYFMTSGVIHVLTMKPPAMGTRFYKGESYPRRSRKRREKSVHLEDSQVEPCTC